MAELDRDVELIRRPWIKSTYYEDAERWTYLFWNEESLFRQMFDVISKKVVVELACGHGRHAELAAPLCESLILIDVIEENLDACRARLKEFDNVSIVFGNGLSFPLETASVDAVYCYDAMVHFSPDIIESYLKDTARVLKNGGRALYHHSNLGESGETPWDANPHARNYMTRRRFAQLAHANGFAIEQQRVIPWGRVADLDCISLIRKP